MRRCPLSRGTCLLHNLDTRLCLMLPLPHRISQLHTACRRQRIELLPFLRKCQQHTGHKSLLMTSLLTTSTCLQHKPSMPSLPNPFGGLMDGIKKGIDQLDDIVDLKDDDQKKRRR